MANWPGDDAVFPVCVPIIKEFEGFRAAPYRDSAGIPTIGYGTIRYPDGLAVAMGDPPVTEAQAGIYLRDHMAPTAAYIAGRLEHPATLNQAAAMLSLAYNIGTGGFGSSSVLRFFNKGNIPDAADAFLMWNKARVNGALTPVQGLTNRRMKERALFLRPDA